MEDEVESDEGFFPSINQFRKAVKTEREWAEFHNVKPRVRPFRGTVKLHGTNAGITSKGGALIYRSRTRVIVPGDDNHGFAAHMAANETAMRNLFANLPGDDVTIFGEWCGAGVQSNVGVSAEQKMFVAFAVRNGEEWGDLSEIPAVPEARVFNILHFPHWEREIDFAHPEQAQNDLVALTEAVEAQCPVAMAFGHEGIGEGIVWTPQDDDNRSRFWFKVKGEKHSASKVKVLAAVDVERFRQRDELVAAVVTDNRLRQGLDLHVNEFHRPLEMNAISEFLRWVFADIMKEEADTIAASGFEQKELGKGISDVAKRFYTAEINRA